MSIVPTGFELRDVIYKLRDDKADKNIIEETIIKWSDKKIEAGELTTFKYEWNAQNDLVVDFELVGKSESVQIPGLFFDSKSGEMVTYKFDHLTKPDIHLV